MDCLTIQFRDRPGLIDDLRSYLRRRRGSVVELSAGPASGLKKWHISFSSLEIDIRVLMAELQGWPEVLDVRHDRVSNVDSSILSRSTSLALSLSTTYPDIIGTVREFENSLPPDRRDGTLYDLGDKVGRLLERHPTLQPWPATDDLAYCLSKVGLAALTPFAIARSEANHLILFACPFCRDLESTTPGCSFLAGLLSGLFSVGLGREILAKEVECKAQGGQTCTFELRDA